MSILLQAIAIELERPRELPSRVVNQLSGAYSLDRDAIGAFLVNELPKLEDYEIDLALSPLFTPMLPDQAVIAELLGQQSVPAAQWPALIEQLVSRPTRAQLVTDDGQTHAVPLREVTVERYVRRLRLDATIPEELFQLLEPFESAGDRSLLKAVARRAIWENEALRPILVRFVASTAAGGPCGPADALALLRLVESYEPADGADLLARIPRWQQALRHEIDVAASPKPFFNERVQELHGGGRDQRQTDDTRITAKQNERAFLDRLQRVLTS